MMSHREIIEGTYTDTCTVVEHRKKELGNKTKTFEDMTVYENIPCRLSFSNTAPATGTGTASAVSQTVKLFISSDLNIKAGSKISVIRDGRTLQYKSSGVPAVYNSHQEIDLELFAGWA